VARRLVGVTSTFTDEELAREAGVPPETVEWLTGIGILKPREPGPFRFGDVFRTKMVTALLQGGFTREQVEWAVSEGHLNLERVEEYFPLEPGPRSERTFGAFLSTVGPRASRLPAVYAALGLPEPDHESRLPVDEEERLRRFLEGWRLAPSDDALIRAARLVAEGTRLATMGWAQIFDEQVVRPAQQRLFRGEVEKFPEEVRQAFSALADVQPSMMRWLMERYQEQRVVENIVEGFERFFASLGQGPAPQPAPPPAVVFVDLSGYTRLTEERGDETAVRFAAMLQQEAHTVASANEGRLVKLLGDGAMLRFPDAERGLQAAMALVRALSRQPAVSAHAGVHAGPVIERDLDLFGRTVNLASRIADAAGPGEVLVTETVAEAVDGAAHRFDRMGMADLKGISEPVALFRVRTDES
jgi:adenylate cyclase